MNAMNEQTARMRAALRRMLLRYPLHAEWLSPEQWHAQPRIGTMAVSIRLGVPRFFYSPNFVCSCSDAELEGVIHHEMNHLVFRHPWIDPMKFPNSHALTIAEEVTVNEYVPEPLPADPLTLREFPELPAGEGTLARYHRLCGIDDLAKRVRTLDMHAIWNATAPGSAIAENMHPAMVAQLLRTRNRAALEWAIGDLANGGFGIQDGSARIDDLSELRTRKKSIDWHRVLAGSLGQRARREATFCRPPRRVPEHVGVVPAMVCRPEKPSVMAVIDTSSSMQRSQFERIGAELDELRRLAQVTVVQCDKEIRAAFALRGRLQTIIGRGGTDLRPPLEVEFLNRHRPRLVVFFTDGDGPVAKQAPRVPVIWCLTGAAKVPAPWGRVIKLG